MSCARRFARCLVSIHVPLAEHDDIVFGFCLFVKVSIHVPLAEHDLVAPVELRLFEVSIHVPLAEHDPSYCVSPDRLCVSIHVPLAEHDQVIIHPPRIQESFNSRAPRGARPRSRRSRLSRRSFQFTCPSRSTTPGQDQRPGRCQVSIHVPLAEHDLPCAVSFALGARFNSRAPRGARRSTSGATTTASWFQFTCPSRSTTSDVRRLHFRLHRFNSRAPRGARRSSRRYHQDFHRFNSRAPRGARHRIKAPTRSDVSFNSRAPRGARPFPQL